MSKTKQEIIALAQEYLDRWYIETSPVLYQIDIADYIKKSSRSKPNTEIYEKTSNPKPKKTTLKTRTKSNRQNVCYDIKPLDPNLLENLKPTFSQTLFDLIKQQGISETDCYKAAGLDRRLFSKIRSDDNYQPKKATVFALIFGLKLNLKDATTLLKAAGYSISHSLKTDVLIEFLITEQVYNIVTVNEVLYKYGCPLLGNVE